MTLLNQDQLAERRKGKRVVARVSASEILGKPLTAEPPALTPLDPAETHRKGMETVFGSFLADPHKMGLLCSVLRVRYPDLAQFSDTQLIRIARGMYDQAMRQATYQAFDQLGRGKELQIKTEGF